MKKLLFVSVLLAIAGCSKSNRGAQLSDVEFYQQIAEIKAGVDKLGVDVRNVWKDPEIIEGFARIEFYEQELKKPVPKPTKEEVLKDLDKLWDEAAKRPYVSNPEREKELLRVAGLKIGD